jgi:hypothetical protein
LWPWTDGGEYAFELGIINEGYMMAEQRGELMCGALAIISGLQAAPQYNGKVCHPRCCFQ